MREKIAEPRSCRTTHDQICDGALKHYRRLSDECCDWLNTVEGAIEFYRKYGNQEHGWLHKDDPSGLIAGEHELTVQEALDRLPLLLKVAECVPIEGDCMDIFECPKDGSLCTTDNCPIDDALTFNGERIRRNDEGKDR